GVAVGARFDEDDGGWYRSELTLGGGAPLVLERWLADEEGIRAELRSWAAYLETLDYSPNAAALMEQALQARPPFTLTPPDRPPQRGRAGARLPGAVSAPGEGNQWLLPGRRPRLLRRRRRRAGAGVLRPWQARRRPAATTGWACTWCSPWRCWRRSAPGLPCSPPAGSATAARRGPARGASGPRRRGRASRACRMTSARATCSPSPRRTVAIWSSSRGDTPAGSSAPGWSIRPTSSAASPLR